jgi:hypothetical protein
MMARSFEICFPESSGLDRVRNFAEELSLALGDLGNLPMDDADAATTLIVVSRIPKRSLGRCRQLVDRLLKKHFMTDEATIKQLPHA